jgi:hypothetical protein
MTDAYRFFRSLEQHLNEALPGPREVATNIADMVRTSKASRTNLHKSFPEGALLNHYVLPAMHHFVSKLDGMDSDKARESLLSESYRQMGKYASGTPARLSRHPFEKVIGASAQSVVRRWKSAKPTVKSYPDLALRAPCPYRTVFEGKYFSRGGLTAAETALATNIYQAFFYRGLARLPEGPRRPAWDYEYACVLAYDATADGAMLQAWDGLRPRIGKGCWEGAGIYVMILSGRK